MFQTIAIDTSTEIRDRPIALIAKGGVANRLFVLKKKGCRNNMSCARRRRSRKPLIARPNEGWRVYLLLMLL